LALVNSQQMTVSIYTTSIMPVRCNGSCISTWEKDVLVSPTTH